jgi:charged multivesicular body protein 1
MVMDKFEQQFEDLDVQTQYMENAMGNTTALSTPQNDVDRLMQQVADEHGLELHMEMGAVPGTSLPAQPASGESDELKDRLAKLRNP